METEYKDNEWNKSATLVESTTFGVTSFKVTMKNNAKVVLKETCDINLATKL